MGAFPIRFQDRAVAALVVYASAENAFGSEELRLLDEVASDVSFALDAFDRDTLRREAQESLQKTTHLLQTLIDSSPLAIVVMGEDSRVLLWSPAAEKDSRLERRRSHGPRRSVGARRTSSTR